MIGTLIPTRFFRYATMGDAPIGPGQAEAQAAGVDTYNYGVDIDTKLAQQYQAPGVGAGLFSFANTAARPTTAPSGGGAFGIPILGWVLILGAVVLTAWGGGGGSQR